MSNTSLHKAKGRWNAGIQDIIPDCLRFHWKRHNSERGYFANIRAMKRGKIEQKNRIKIQYYGILSDSSKR